MVESACSRVGHIYRYRPISVNLHIKYDFVSTVCIHLPLYFSKILVHENRKTWSAQIFIQILELQKSGRSLDG